jgi:hypothetical protein
MMQPFRFPGPTMSVLGTLTVHLETCWAYRVGVRIALYTCDREVFGLDLGGSPATMTDVFRVLTQSLRENSGLIRRLGHDRFHPNSFIYHPTNGRRMVYSPTQPLVQETNPSTQGQATGKRNTIHQHLDAKHTTESLIKIIGKTRETQNAQ